MGFLRITAIALAALSGLFIVSAAAQAEGDAAQGKKAYRISCFGCHGDRETVQSVGPPLVGLFGRRAGTVHGSPYSRNLYAANIVWDEAALQRYLAAPSAEVHGTIMPIGVHDPRERDDIIAYLKTLQ
jgi:cytochrome c2